MNRDLYIIKLGNAIRLLRKLRGETVDSMAYKLGYKDSSTYSKLERGEVSSIDLIKLIQICDILGTSPFLLCLGADMNLLAHKGSILTKKDFLLSLKDLAEPELDYLLALFQDS